MKLRKLQKNKIKKHKGTFSQPRAQCIWSTKNATNLQNKRQFSTAQQAAAHRRALYSWIYFYTCQLDKKK